MADDTMTTDAPAFTSGGTARERVALPAELFDGTVNIPVMHQAVKAFLANQRQGNAKTKIRKYVTGGNQKPWKQKGTGRARQGSIRAPQWVGGGTVFGPIPRSYAEYVPRQVRALARKSALNARLAENALIVVDRFEFDAPKTSRVVALMARLGLDGKKVLILTDGAKTNVFLSARNLPTVHVMPYADVSTYHILWSDTVVIEAPAIGQDLEPVAESAPAAHETEKRAAAKKASAAKGEAKDARKKEQTAKKVTTKSAAKKSSAKPAAKASAKPAAKKSAAKKPSAPKKKGK